MKYITYIYLQNQLFMNNNMANKHLFWLDLTDLTIIMQSHIFFSIMKHPHHIQLRQRMCDTFQHYKYHFKCMAVDAFW